MGKQPKGCNVTTFFETFCALSVVIYAFSYSIALYWRENNGLFDDGNFIVMFWIKEREMLRDKKISSEGECLSYLICTFTMYVVFL